MQDQPEYPQFPNGYIPTYSELLKIYWPIKKAQNIFNDLQKEINILREDIRTLRPVKDTLLNIDSLKKEAEYLQNNIKTMAWVKKVDELQDRIEHLEKTNSNLVSGNKKIIKVMETEFGIQIAETRKRK